MSDHKTVVWVKTSLISKALGRPDKSSPSSKVKKPAEWPWIRAVVLSGDLGSSGVNLLITQEDSEYHEQKVEIPAALPNKASGLVMANEWAEVEAKLPPDDLIGLTHLHEPSVVYCLKKRYDQDIIYTATGPILIALNPFKDIPKLYDDDTMGNYWKKGEKVDDSLELPPHVYGTADRAFRSMMRALYMSHGDAEDESVELKKNQSILVSGESGAGKTVSTKHIMKYLATLSQRKAEHTKRRRAPSPGRGEAKRIVAPPSREPRRLSRRISRTQSWKKGALIEEKILESNPILEAFANARTIRNDNSSRFGKFIELQFKQTGSLIGACIDTYLLEKVRLIHVGPGERTFHVFYELLAAATEDERRMFMMGNYTAQDFKMTSASGTYTRRDGVNDSSLFQKLVEAMSTMGLDDSIQTDIFAVCVAFLHASNLTFEAITDDSSKVDESNPHLQPVLKLLGLEKDTFQDALCQFEIEAGNTSYTRQLNKELAAKGLDALVKATYGAMFSFIVQSINKQIDYKPKRGDPHEMAKAAFIGVLDIFGFEYFEHNSFEQLCINYCNEALQQQFNRHIFKLEQEEYQREGIAWEFIEFPDNQDVIDLIDEKHTGIIPILTDQCRTPRGTDKLFAEAMYKACGGHARFEASDLQRGQRKFAIQHYAGPVVYEVEGFLEKNKDEIPRGATNLLESSSKPFVQLLGKINDVSVVGASAGSSVNKSGHSKRPTVGGQFAAQLTELRKRIDRTDPHYIRCLKPNEHLAPDDFNNVMIADQLRYAGVLEAIRVSRVGYPQRYTHDLLLQRYHFVATDAIRGAGDKQIDVLVDAIAKQIWMTENPNEAIPADLLGAVGIQKGETKVFLRQKAFDCMEAVRTQQLSATATDLERVARGFLARRRYMHTMEKIVLTQACLRRFLARKYLQAVRESRAATTIQSTFKMSKTREQFVKKRAVAVWCQKMERGRAARTEYGVLDEERREARAAAKLQNDSATKIQNIYRSKIARDQLVILKHQKMEADKARGAKFTPEEQVIFQKLEQQQRKAAIAAARATAVAKETAYSKDKEVEMLRKELAESREMLKRFQAMKIELADTRAELEITKDELSALKGREEVARTRLTTLGAENDKLKQQVEQGAVFDATGGYKSVHFSEYSDLKQLDERIHGIVHRSQQGRKDLHALVQSLAILK